VARTTVVLILLDRLKEGIRRGRSRMSTKLLLCRVCATWDVESVISPEEVADDAEPLKSILWHHELLTVDHVLSKGRSQRLGLWETSECFSSWRFVAAGSAIGVYRHAVTQFFMYTIRLVDYCSRPQLQDREVPRTNAVVLRSCIPNTAALILSSINISSTGLIPSTRSS
jgi:hypothetical protein